MKGKPMKTCLKPWCGVDGKRCVDCVDGFSYAIEQAGDCGHCPTHVTEASRGGWPGEWCKRCNRRNPVGFDVSDEIWQAVTGGANKVFCTTCFDEMAEAAGVAYRLQQADLWPVSWSTWKNQPLQSPTGPPRLTEEVTVQSDSTNVPLPPQDAFGDDLEVGELQRLQAQLAQVTAERDELRTQLDELSEDHERMLHKVTAKAEGLERGADQWAERATKAEADRDRLQAEVERLTEQARQSYDHAEAEAGHADELQAKLTAEREAHAKTREELASEREAKERAVGLLRGAFTRLLVFKQGRKPNVGPFLAEVTAFLESQSLEVRADG